MGDLEEYTESVARSVRRRRVDPRGLAAGQLEGLTSTGPTRLRPARRETEKHHSGYLTGQLIRWMSVRGRAINQGLAPWMMYAAPLAHDAAQRALAEDSGLARAHLYAVLMLERKLESPLPEADERMVFGWLCEVTGAPVTPATVGRLERLRAKRLERHGWA